MRARITDGLTLHAMQQSFPLLWRRSEQCKQLYRQSLRSPDAMICAIWMLGLTYTRNWPKKVNSVSTL